MEVESLVKDAGRPLTLVLHRYLAPDPRPNPNPNSHPNPNLNPNLNLRTDFTPIPTLSYRAFSNWAKKHLFLATLDRDPKGTGLLRSAK